MKILGVVILAIAILFTYFKRKYEFRNCKNRVMKLNRQKIVYNKNLVNKQFN